MSLFLNASFSPRDLDVMRAALNAWCMENHVEIGSSQAQWAASAALDLYNAGHDNTEKLLSAMKNCKLL